MMIANQKHLETSTVPHQEGTNTFNHSVKVGSILFIIGILILMSNNQKDQPLLLTIIGVTAILGSGLITGLGYHRARELDKQAALSRASILKSHTELQLQTFITEQSQRQRVITQQSRPRLQQNEDFETKNQFGS